MCTFQYNVDRLDTHVKAEASFKVKGGLRTPLANQESPDSSIQVLWTGLL